MISTSSAKSWQTRRQAICSSSNGSHLIDEPNKLFKRNTDKEYITIDNINFFRRLIKSSIGLEQKEVHIV